MTKNTCLVLFFVFFSLIGHAQLSYEHLSNELVKYRFNGDEKSKETIFKNFINRSNTAILFDFSGNKDQEYLFEQEFNLLFARLNQFLNEHPDEVKTVLFKSVSEVWVDRIFTQAQLTSKKHTQSASMEWESPEVLSRKGKQLIVFFLDGSNTQNIIHGNYVHDLGSFQLSGEVVLPGQLLFLSVELPKDTEISQFQLTPNFVDAFIEVWKATGQIPNFILLDGVTFPQRIYEIINSTERLYGSVSFENAGQDVINWKGDFPVTTGNTFCFPAYSGETFSLTPQSPGYSFSPEQLVFNGQTNELIKIKSIKKNLSDGVTAFFPLDEGINDISSNHLVGESSGIVFTDDFNRSKVASLEGKYFARLPDLKDLGIVNESFTISTWIKLDSIDMRDQIILSSIKNKYSEGLHVLVRKKKPYFAFYHNDLEGKTVLEADKWYNIVWRYRKELQQQAIFINGKLDTLSGGRAPFRGVGNLILGHRETSLGVETFFDGKIDDVIFWNRALGESEILNVYQGSFEMETAFPWYIVWIPLTLVFLVTVLVGFKSKFFAKKTTTSDLVITKSPTILNQTECNAIYMFGGLKVLGRDGTNITNEITPRLKELFILLYLATLKSKKGISSEDLSINIWPDLSRDKAINNRGVSTTKLRQVLSKLDGVELKYNNQFWTLVVADDVYSDYKEFLDLVNGFSSEEENLNKLSKIIRYGDFLPNLSKEWLDPYKFEVSNKIIDIYTPELNRLWNEKEFDLLIDYCDNILTFDVVHEIAIKYKVAALKNQKKHEQALKVYQGFVKLYHQFYSEEFTVSFNDFHP
ncbi:LamG domain-containing protein [Reichenbachiella sp. MALMAid0571]|uniref:LamG domain-containing protein n=1 Tax=Reichenbachiella sp. MALMAid0571 TaxID=3143939 RepID=UPI0032DFB380